MRRGAKPTKARVKSKLPIAPKSPKNEGSRVRDLEKRLAESLEREAEALEQQSATSEILRVISSSPTELQPVLDAVAERAARLGDSFDSSIFRVDGDMVRLVAHKGPIPEAGRATPPDVPIVRGTVNGRSIIERRTIQVADLQAETQEFPEGSARARQIGWRTQLSVPLLREGTAIGVIVMRRIEARPFSDKQIELVQTFADQVVIAIENVRLFTELQASNRELTTALDTQTATSDILRVISRSQADVQPVFDAIVASAIRLMGASASALTRVSGDYIELTAFRSADNSGEMTVRGAFPQPLQSEGAHAKAIRDRVPVNVAEAQTDPQLREIAHAIARAVGYQSMVAVPMLHHDVAVGTIAATRREPGGFTNDEIALLQTFADQAVIAIENARLLSELQQRNEALTQAHAQVTEALDQQTATSEILRVISSSPTNLQPVLDAIANNAARVCGSYDATVLLREGDFTRRVAHYGPIATDYGALRPLSSGYVANRAILEGQPVHVHDILTTERGDLSDAQEAAPRSGYRTLLAVPLLREGEAIGALTLRRREVQPFTGKQIDLLKTFADQAVIAIENVRLFNELQEKNRALTQAHTQVTESLEQQTATSEVLRVIAGSPTDLQPVLDALVESAGRLCQAADTFLLLVEGDQLRVAALHGSVEGGVISHPIQRGWVAGRAVMELRTVHVEDLANARSEFPLGWEIAVRLGHRTALATPLVRKGVPIGALFLRRQQVREFSDKEIALLQTFADQAVIAIENVRLFKELEASNQEIAEKSRQIEIASQHKSEFLANMSHELRTPLNAIIGFSEVLSDRMFGELNEKQAEYLKDIYGSGTHLLSLINDILDLSKIEAGRMELELTDFHLPTALDNALTLVRERAGRRDITLQMSVDERLGEVRADERKIRQVVLNLLSNAIKFTPEGGRIEVAAVPKNGSVEVSVSDTGVGIAPEDQEAVFEEFRQVGAAEKKAEGTGLGLTLCRKFVELHGGRIWVRSQVGVGSTFTFTIPVRCGE
jgi:two-component system, NtrC family, sensor kinase